MTGTPYHPAAFGLQGVIALSNELERELARAMGLHPTDYRALSALSQAGPLAVGALAERLGATAATTTAIVNRLEGHGYVLRQRVDGDRRQVQVTVAPAGFQRIMDLMTPLLVATNEHLLSLSADEQRAIAEFLDVAQQQLRDHLHALTSREDR